MQVNNLRDSRVGFEHSVIYNVLDIKFFVYATGK